jgi:hypothetical protein
MEEPRWMEILLQFHEMLLLLLACGMEIYVTISSVAKHKCHCLRVHFSHSTYLKVSAIIYNIYVYVDFFQMRINGPSSNYDAAMSQFELLLNNKYFLLTFIETLEGQRAFKLRDK